MKHLYTLIAFTLLTQVFAQDHFAGAWKNSYLRVSDKVVRVSYKEVAVAPTHGLYQGGRMAYNLYIDMWNTQTDDEVSYSFHYQDKVLDGVLIKESANHQYQKITKNSEIVWLQGNEDFDHRLTIDINGELLEFELEL
jgi:hypothetical protein